MPNQEIVTRPARILVDCTETYLSGINTGIQRVVRSIVERSDLITQYTGVPCIPVIAIGDRFYPLSSFPSLLKGSHGRRRFLEAGKSFYHFIDSLWKKLPVWREGQNARSNRSSEKRSFFSSSRVSLKRVGRNVLMRLFLGLLLIPDRTPLLLGAGDLLIMPDMFWGMKDPIRAATSFFDRGGMVISVVHDLIPLQYPQFCHEGSVEEFQKTLPQIISLSSGILTVSRSAQKELATYLSKNFPGRYIPTRYFYHGADMASKNHFGETIRPLFHSLISGEGLYLMVGTIQPHKGHLVVLEAFQSMWAEGVKANLCILGRLGGSGEGVLKSLRASKFLEEKLFICQDANDAELSFLYSHAKALVLASFAEGFGLPLVEAMNQNLSVVASDIPVFREIGGDYPEFFESGSAKDLVRAILKSEKKEKGEELPHSRTWITWDESVHDLSKNIIDLYLEAVMAARASISD